MLEFASSEKYSVESDVLELESVSSNKLVCDSVSSSEEKLSSCKAAFASMYASFLC